MQQRDLESREPSSQDRQGGKHKPIKVTLIRTTSLVGTHMCFQAPKKEKEESEEDIAFKAKQKKDEVALKSKKQKRDELESRGPSSDGPSGGGQDVKSGGGSHSGSA